MTRPDPPTRRSQASSVEILLVEDHPGDVRLMREALREEKITNALHVARDGVEALAFLRREGPFASAPRPDLVLLDLNLPRKHGREVLEEMKRDPRVRDIPVVVVTASSADSDRRLIDRGAAGFVTKPVDFRQLARIVQKITDLWISIETVQRDAPPQHTLIRH